MPFEPNDKTRKFIRQARTLVDSGQVGGYKEIADAIDWDRTAVSNVINGRRNIPPEVFKRFTDVYKLGEIVEPDVFFAETALQNQAYVRVILRAMAELLSKQREEPVTKTLTDLEAAVRQEIQQLTERLK